MILSDHFISLNVKLTAIFRIISSKYSLSFSQYCIIMKIESSGISMSDLAYGLGLDKSTLTRNIDVLINRNIVEKFRDSEDLRVYKVFLSNIGENLKLELYSDVDNFEEVDMPDFSKLMKLWQKNDEIDFKIGLNLVVY